MKRHNLQWYIKELRKWLVTIVVIDSDKIAEFNLGDTNFTILLEASMLNILLCTWFVS